MVCSKQIDIVIDGDVIRAVQYTGGCNGNLKGIGSLVAGKNGGVTDEQLAAAINSRRLHMRKDGQPLSTKQIWWAVKTFKSTLTYAGGRIFLMI